MKFNGDNTLMSHFLPIDIDTLRTLTTEHSHTEQYCSLTDQVRFDRRTKQIEIKPKLSMGYYLTNFIYDGPVNPQ